MSEFQSCWLTLAAPSIPMCMVSPSPRRIRAARNYYQIAKIVHQCITETVGPVILTGHLKVSTQTLAFALEPSILTN